MALVEGIGEATWGIGKKIAPVLSSLGSAALKGSKWTGKNVGAPMLKTAGGLGIDAAVSGTKYGYKGAKAFTSSLIKGDARNPAVFAAKESANLGKKMVKISPYESKFDPKTGKTITKGGMEITALGIAAAGGAVGVMGMMDAGDRIDTAQMGVVDPTRRTATASFQTPSYDMTAASGASGDLVFALNATRTGGYL